jgi:hypothetical protein
MGHNGLYSELCSKTLNKRGMRIFILYILVVFINFKVIAQTGIGTTTPNASAKLDVYATNKGFLPPRIALLSTTDVATILTPATGLIIYNTATAGTTPTNVIPGYYYWDGSKWNGLVDQGALNSFSGFVPNYAQSNASRVTNVTTNGTIIVSQTITTSGRPIQIIASGDANPLTNGGWCQLQLYRDGTAIGKKIQAESSASNENVPYCLNYIDNPTAGTYTYSVKAVNISSAFDFGEADGNQITLLELGAWSAGTMPVSKGGTGNSSYTSGSVIFSDGTNLSQSNANLFWDNSNGRLGIGTNAPTAKLNISGGGIKINSGLGNTSSRPALNASSIGNYEIRGVGGGVTQIDNQDDGFLRLSAGGGTNSNTQSSIDLSGYSSTVSDMNRTIVMRTSGTERLRIDASGNFIIPADATASITSIPTKVGGLVNAGTFVQMDNIKATCTTSGYRGLSVASVSGSFYCNIGANYGLVNGGSGGNSSYNYLVTTAPSSSWFNWGFGSAGDVSVYNITDTTNSRMYRITLQIGAGYNNNSIVIERLF